MVFKDEWPGLGKTTKVRQVSSFTDTFLSDNQILDDSVLARYEIVLPGFTGRMTPEKAEALSKNPNVDFVEPDKSVSLAGFRSNNSNRKAIRSTAAATTASSQVVPWGIARVAGPADGTGKKAWILDTGIDLDHPDLNVDVTNSISFVPGETPDDLNGHGTHVAGILAAKDNDIDVVGVAAGATVVAVKVLDSNGRGQNSWIIDGLDHVVQNGSNNHIINMSLGGPKSSSMDEAVKNTGIRTVVAAGNDGGDANNYSPARVENYNVLTISAFESNDNFASFSNHSNPPIDFSGPGVNVYSLWKNGGTDFLDGTSMATPHIAGMVLMQGNSFLPYDGTVTNDPDGTPDKIARLPSDVEAYISGPSFVSSGSEGTWTVQASGGVPPFEYDWQRNEYDPPHWEYLHDSDDSYSETVTEYFELRVEVTDATNTVIFTPVFTVATGSSSF